MNSRIMLIIPGFFASILMLLFYLYQSKVEFEIARNGQIERAELVRRKLDEFATVSSLVSRFIKEDLVDKKLTKKIVEQNLLQYLHASPKDIIFGIGVWFEPFYFSKNEKLFGPYVHRIISKNIKETNGQTGDSGEILTYEWSTAEYNYPKQDWYIKGFNNNGESFFVDPYFDGGLVYVTNSRLFFTEKNKPAGVISVDMVLPQLQNIVERESRIGQETIVIVNRQGKLLAHPLKNDFFKLVESGTDSTDQSLLQYSVNEFEKKMKIDTQHWIKSELVQDQLGWKVLVFGSEDYLLSSLFKLRQILLISFFTMWLFLLGLLWLLTHRNRERLEAEAKIESSRVRLVQSSKMAALGEMAGGIAHEINNPLAIIIGKTQQIGRQLAMMDGSVDEKIFSSLQTISQTAERIGRIISGLRTFSRTGEGDPLQSEPLREIVNGTVALCSAKFKNSSIDLVIGEVPDIVLDCRATQISQVILNLLSNAFDAVSELEERWVKLQFKLENDGQSVRIEVIDSGQGIPTEVAKKMMQPFFTTKVVGSGTGLGLSISKGIVEDHQGQLIFDESAPNTTFVVLLPAESTLDKVYK